MEIKNKGSATIELSILISVILGIFFLYISLFLFMIESSKEMGKMAEALYSEEKGAGEGLRVSKQGDIYYVFAERKSGMFDMDLQLSCYGGTAVKNIRRWQLAMDTVSAGKHE